MYADDIKLAGKKHNLDPMGKLLNKEVDLGEPTSFLDQVYLGCTQRQLWNKQRYILWTITKPCLNREFPRRNWKNTMLGKFSYFFVVLRYVMSCQEMCGTILWVGKEDNSSTLQRIYSMHWWPSFQRRRIEIRGIIVNSMLSNSSEMLILARIGRPDILWSVNKFARSITKWTKACDKPLSRLISYIHHTCEY